MAIDVVLRLDDIGLFKKPRGREVKSQYQRACEIRDQFAHCMRNALCGNGCVMPYLCAYGDSSLSCAHLTVDYANFTGKGIPLTRRSAALIDQRLRAIGTLVYRGGRYTAGIPSARIPATSTLPRWRASRRFRERGVRRAVPSVYPPDAGRCRTRPSVLACLRGCFGEQEPFGRAPKAAARRAP